MATSNVIKGKAPVEEILVCINDTFVESDALAAAGVPLTTAATGVIALADRQIGCVGAGLVPSGTAHRQRGDFLDAADTPAEIGYRFKVVQGTANSGNIADSLNYPFSRRPFEESSVIDVRNVISATDQAFRQDSNSIWELTSFPTTAADTEYTLRLGYRGRRVDEFNSSTHGIPGINFSYTPTAASTAADLINQIGWKINRNSRSFNLNNASFGAGQPLVAFAIDISGGAGTALSTIDAAANAGTVVSVANSGSTTFSHTMTAGQCEAIRLLIADSGSSVTTSSTVEVIDLDSLVAGLDCLVVFAMDELEAAEDRNPYSKIRLELAVNSDLSATLLEMDTDEGQGLGLQWLKKYRNTAGQRKYHQYRGFEAQKIDYGSDADIVSGSAYNVVSVVYYDSQQLDAGTVSNSPKRLSVLFLDATADTAYAAFISTLDAVGAGFFEVTAVT